MENIKVDNLRDRVYVLMTLLPSDKVTTYGDIAAMAGHPYAARRVGEIAHGGPSNLPWHRLVNSRGGLAVGFPGGLILRSEDGVRIDRQ